MGKITWATKKPARVVVNLNDPAVRARLRREAEAAARDEQRQQAARRAKGAVASHA